MNAPLFRPWKIPGTTLKFLCFTQDELKVGLPKFPYSPRNFCFKDLEEHVQQFNAFIDDILHKLPKARIHKFPKARIV